MPALERLAPEGRVQPDAGNGDAEAVRTDQAHAVSAARLQQARSGVRETGRDDDQRANAAAAALFRDFSDGGSGHDDDGQVHPVWQVIDASDAGQSRQRAGMRVDRDHPAMESAGHDVAE